MSEHVAPLAPHLGPVRFSRLKLMGKSAKIYRASFDRPREDNAQMRAGRLIHAVALGGKVAVYDGNGGRATNAYKDFAARHPDSEVPLKDEYNDACEVCDALMSHREASRLLTGDREKEIAWTDNGRVCGARLDVIGTEVLTSPGKIGVPARFVCDLKTTANAEPRWFQRNAERMGYHAQLDWYRQGAMRALGVTVSNAYIVAVETKYPYEIVTHRLALSALDNGERLWRSWWEKLMVAEQTDVWAGYSEAQQDWDVSGNAELDWDE